MFKIINTGSWDKIAEAPIALIPILSNNTFANDDKRTFMRKRASSSELLDKVANDIQVKDGDIPIHVIALGCTEKYGCNRNGDAFNEDTCRNRHDTFVKFGRYYRHHKSSDPEQSFGKVAASFYNEDMGRVELIILGNGTKEAASRNGGVVMPDDSIQKLAEGKDLAWSMGCFPAGTSITLSSGRYVPIEDIHIGSEVLTHTGSRHKVYFTMQRKYTGKIYTVHAIGMSSDITATQEHPLWIRRLSNTITDSWIPISKVTVSDYVATLVNDIDKELSYIDKELLDNKDVIVDGNIIWRRIEDFYFMYADNIDVYNFSVEEDESYVANDIAVHNCSLPYDVCNVCHHKSASPKEYCTEETCIHPITHEHYPGCKFGMTKLGEDGLQVYVENPNCKFYDISHVTIPADRTAYGCQVKEAAFFDKVAHLPYVVGGAELAEMYGLSFNAFDTPARANEIRNNLCKLAALSDSLPKDKRQLFGFILHNAPQSHKLAELLNTFTKEAKWKSVMALARNNIILSPENYMRIIGKTASCHQLRNYLTNMYNNAIDSIQPEYMEKQIPTVFFEEPVVSYKFGEFIISEQLTPENLQKKLQYAILNEEQFTQCNKKASYDPELEIIAKQYAVYKAAALRNVPETSRDFVTMVTLSDDFIL